MPIMPAKRRRSRRISRKKPATSRPVWRDSRGRFNPRGHFQAVGKALVRLRGPTRKKRGKKLPRAKQPPKWRTKTGKLSARGTYLKVGKSLIKYRGFKTRKILSSGPRRAAPPRRRRAARVEPAPPVEEAPEIEPVSLVGPVSKPTVKPPSGRAGATYYTYFRAFGTFGSRAEMTGRDSPDVLDYDVDEIDAPAAFYSNQSGIMGQVRWEGIVGLSELIARLNARLQYAESRSDGFDFRDEYPVWSYRWHVVEKIGPTTRVIDEHSDSRG